MRQYKDRSMERGILAPLALSVQALAGCFRAKHVAAHNEGPGISQGM
jgi:hypothetical protein